MNIKELGILLLAFIITLVLIPYFKTTSENWQDYVLKPYNYVLSGRDPLYFYRKDRYRRPYRDGFKFYKSYPIPHMSEGA